MKLAIDLQQVSININDGTSIPFICSLLYSSNSNRYIIYIDEFFVTKLVFKETAKQQLFCNWPMHSSNRFLLVEVLDIFSKFTTG